VGEASMLLGRAGASFEPRGPFPAGGQPAGAAGGDVTGDGHPDLLIGDNSIGGFNVKLLRGLGPAGFDPLAQFGAGGPSYGLATADFSADGIDDLVITSGTRLSFMAGGGNDLGAAQHSSTTTSDDAGPMAIADVDGDGRRDVIVLHFAAATFSVQRNIAAAGVTPGSPTAAFATQARSTLSAAQIVTLHSTGDSALHPRRVQMAGAHPDDFVVTGDTCSGELLPKGRSCTMKVRFAPSATGPREAQLQLISDAAPLSIALSGVGGALPAGPRGAAGASGTPRPLLVAAFGNDRVSTRAGKRVRMRFVSTLAGVATLELRRGSRVLARASDAVAAGRNALSIKAPRKRGRYTLALTVTGGGQSVTDSARLTVKRRPA
jgi:FG-GAP-like repeat